MEDYLSGVLTWKRSDVARRKEKVYPFLSTVGIVLILLGFGLQILSNWVPSPQVEQPRIVFDGY